MKMKPLNAFMLAAVLSALVNVASTALVEDSAPWRWTTAGPYAQNLNGKMFTLSANGGGVSFSSPYFNPTPTTWTRRVRTSTTYPSWTTASPTTTWPWTTRTHRYPTTTDPSWTTASPTTTWPWTTRTHRYPTTTDPSWTTTSPSTTWIWTAKTHKYPTTTTYPSWTTASPTTTWTKTTRTHRYPATTYPPWTTASPTRGVSVCLRFLTDGQMQSYSRIFTLSPNRGYLTLSANGGNGGYSVYFGGYSYYSLYLRPNIKFLSYVRPEIWTRVCLTVDTRKNVVQLFSGESGSIRRILPNKFIWSGEPVIDFPGFDGQLTDVQVWDYPLCYREVLGYMSGYGRSGSVLTWSSISYSPRGRVLLEDTYERLEKQPISRRGRLRRPKGEKKHKDSFYMGESKAKEKQKL